MTHYRETRGKASENRQTGQSVSKEGGEEEAEIMINVDRLLEESVNVAIGTAIGIAVSRFVFGES